MAYRHYLCNRTNLSPCQAADLAVADSPSSARRRPAGRNRATRPVAGRRAGSVNSHELFFFRTVLILYYQSKTPPWGSSVIIFLVLKHIKPEFSKDSAIYLSAEASLLLVAIIHETEAVDLKRRAARLCLLSARSCSCWLVCMGNRGSLNVIFEVSFIVFLPFLGRLMKTASAWYFHQRKVPDTDIEAVNQFFWLHFIVVFAGLYSLQYAADVDETKQLLHELNTTTY